MVKLICKNCEYRFEGQIKTNTCPYCGKKMVEEEQNAEELIKEVEEILR